MSRRSYVPVKPVRPDSSLLSKIEDNEYTNEESQFDQFYNNGKFRNTSSRSEYSSPNRQKKRKRGPKPRRTKSQNRNSGIIDRAVQGLCRLFVP